MNYFVLAACAAQGGIVGYVLTAPFIPANKDWLAAFPIAGGMLLGVLAWARLFPHVLVLPQ